MVYHLKNFYFDPEPDNDELRVLKLKNGFLIIQEEAEELLRKIKVNEPLLLDIKDDATPLSYGIRFYSVSIKDLERQDKEKAENEARWAREDIIFKKAEIWYETLTEEEKEMVQQLSYKKIIQRKINLIN